MPRSERRSIVVAVMVAALFLAGDAAGAPRGPLCHGRRATLVGTSSSDRLIGTRNGDVIMARGGDDIVRSLEGDDVVCAGPGADVIRGGDGGDIAIGGSGADLLDLGPSYVPCIPCFGRPNLGRGGPGVDRLTTEDIGQLWGGTGDDYLRASGPDSFLVGGDGNDELVGRGEFDEVSFRGAEGPVTVNLGRGTSEGQGRDLLRGIEDAIGSDFADSITGDEGSNVLDGGGNEDFVNGLAGDDRLSGGASADDDRLDAGEGADILFGDAGHDQIEGGDGIDVIRYAPFFYSDSPSPVSVDLAAGQASGETFGFDHLNGIENVVGTAGPDQLVGDEGPNDMDGGAGRDEMDGGGGDDLLIGYTGIDSFEGGSGEDTLSYRLDHDPVDVDMALGEAITPFGTESFDSIENLVGSGDDDTILGTDEANLIEGEIGDDQIDGRGGADRIWGGTTDLSRYSCSDVIVVFLEEGDVLRGGEGNDWITADDEVDSFPYCVEVEPGADNVFGDGGDDALFGQGADDMLDGGDGVDAIDGGGGRDTCTAGETENACEF